MLINRLISQAIFGSLVTISFAERLIGREAPAQTLTSSQIQILSKIFHQSVDFTVVILKVGDSHLLTSTKRAFVMGNTIYLPTLAYSMELLVHEMVHIWQYQHGGVSYMGESLWGQYVGEGYDFAKGIYNGKEWAKLNPEQQAELIEAGYAQGYFDNPQSRFMWQGEDLTNYLATAVAQLRLGKGAPS